jgi:hypothetical protein
MSIGTGIYLLALVAGAVVLVITGHPWWAFLLLILSPEIREGR